MRGVRLGGLDYVTYGNSFENCKRKHKSNDSEDDYKIENKKEIKEKIGKKINGKIIWFVYHYKVNEEGKYIIKYLFTNNLTKANHMF